jgi:hypothetical protein
MPWIDNPGAYVAAAEAPYVVAPLLAAEAIAGAGLYAYNRYQRSRPQPTMAYGKMRRYNPYKRVKPRKRGRVIMATSAPSRHPVRYVNNSARYPSLNWRIGGVVGKELKWTDTTYQGDVSADRTAAMADPSGPNCLTNIVQGTGPTQRDGLKTHIKHLYIHGHLIFEPALQGSADPNDSIVAWTTSEVVPPGTSSTSGTITAPTVPYDPPTVGARAQTAIPYVKIMLVMDKQTNGAQMTSGDLLDDTGSAAFDSLTFRRLENSARFVVLAQKCIYPQDLPMGTGVSCAKVVPFKMAAKKLDCYQRYNSTAGDITQIQDCSLHMIAIKTSYNTAAQDFTSTVRLEYVARTRFYAL